MGIGLTIAKSMVEAHGGCIEVRSAGLGQGAQFEIRLPLAAPPQAEPVCKSEPEPALPRRVLLVDDNRDVAESLQVLLETMGHEVRVANSGKAALAAVQGFTPEIALIDIEMPEMSGYELAQKLRQRPEMKNTVLAAQTGYGMKEFRQQANRAGFTRYLMKPIDGDALCELLENAAGTS